jgi:hypothetical protein
MDVATVKVAEELYLMPHGFIHMHEGRLLGCAKPTYLLVTNIQEPGNCLKVIPNAFVEVFLCAVRFVEALLTNNVGPLCMTNILETLTHQVKQC